MRGRAGRQGDPGESRVYVALDDDLPARWGLRELLPARLVPERSDAPLESSLLGREISRVQRAAEDQSREVRRILSEYAAPLEEQRGRPPWRSARRSTHRFSCSSG